MLQVYGWRARIGLVAPSRGDTMLYEFYRVVPEGVLAVPYSCELTVLEKSEFDRVRAAYEHGVKAMTREQVDLIYVGGTPVQVSQDPEGFTKLLTGLQAMSDVPLVTSAGSELAALQRTAVGGEAAVLTPHGEEVNAQLLAFLADGGVRVGHMRGLGVSKAYEISFLSDYDVYRETVALAKEAPAAVAAHITCPRWPTITRLAAMEEATGRPVTSSCQASLWQICSRLNIVPRPGAWGSLLDGLRT